MENALLAEAWLAHGLVVIGHGATAAPRAASALAEAIRVGATTAAGRLRVELATIARTADATEQAQRLLDPVLASSDAEPLLRADACLEAAMGPRRDASESRELLDAAVRALDELGGEEGEFGLAHVDALAASRARAEGRLTESVKRARDGLTRSLGNSMTGGQLEPVSPHLTTLLCYELCQALVADGHPEPVQEISRPILGWAVRPGSLVPAARLHLLLASAVQRAAGAFEDALASATWVAEAIESRDLPELEAQCQTVLGEIWDSSGNLAEAVRATRQAHLAHRAHSERMHQVRSLLVQVAGGTLAPPLGGRPEIGPSAKAADPRSLGRRVARRYAEGDGPGPSGSSGGPSEPPGSPRLPGRPLNPRWETGRNDEPRHGKPANGHHTANGFDGGRGSADVGRATPEGLGDRAPESLGDRPTGSRSSGGDLPSGPVDPAFSNEFAASIRQFGETEAKPPADPGPPTLPRGLNDPTARASTAGPGQPVAPRGTRDDGGPPSRHRGPRGIDRGDDRTVRREPEPARSPGGRRRRPLTEGGSAELPESVSGSDRPETTAADDLPGVLWLSPDTPEVEPASTGHTRASLTERELADQLSVLAAGGDARPAHLVVVDISMPDGSRCGPAARTVAERVADQLDGQRPVGAHLYLLGDDTVTVSLTDADPESVNRWLRTVSGGISRRWTTLADELPAVATFRIVVRPLDSRWSMLEHLAEVRGRLHPDTVVDQPGVELPPRTGQRGLQPSLPGAGAPETEDRRGRRDGPGSFDREDSSGWDRAFRRDDAPDSGRHEPEPRARHSVGAEEQPEEVEGGHRQWLAATPGSGGRRRRPESEPDLTPASDERDPLTDPAPFGMSSTAPGRPVSRRDSAAVAGHDHPDGWPIDDETDRAVDIARPDGHDRREEADRAPARPTELTALGAPSEIDPPGRFPEPPGSESPPDRPGTGERDQDGPGTAQGDGSDAPARPDEGAESTETETETDAAPAGGRKKRVRGEISTLAMEAVAPPGPSRDAEPADTDSTPEPEKPPARNWDRPVSELSFAELIDGALAAYREA